MTDTEMLSTLVLISGRLLGWASALKQHNLNRSPAVIAKEMEEFGRELYCQLFGAEAVDKTFGQ